MSTSIAISLTERRRRAQQEQTCVNALAAIQRCEEQLAAARRAYSTAIAASGADTAGCFADCEFVKRSSAEKWVEKAKRAAGARSAKKADRDPNPSPEEDPPDDDTSPDDEPRTPPMNRKKAKPEVVDSDEDAVRAAAAAIIAAGRKARGIKPSPKESAAKIYESNLSVIEAEIAAGHPVRYTADMIIACGKRRRGEL
jgi:hypothetical protein